MTESSDLMDLMRVRAMPEPWGGGVQFMVTSSDLPPGHGGAVHVCRHLVMEPIDRNAIVTAPTFRLGLRAAQVLMDDLWASGIRPTEGAGSAGERAAMQRHLDQMTRDHERLMSVLVNKASGQGGGT